MVDPEQATATSATPASVKPQSTSTATPADIVIRRAVASDAAAVADLIGTTWATAFGSSVSPSDLEYFLTVTMAVPRVAADMADATRLYLVAEPPSSGSASSPSAPALAGVAHLVLDTAEACLTLPAPRELRRFYVDAAHHGRGLAGALMRAAEDAARADGGKSLWLGVWEHNARAQRFYAKMGFKEVGEHYFMVGESRRRDWVMEKAL
ncbi:hypothetical protein Q5752_002638 [Cryptotrichosporon argae]